MTIDTIIITSIDQLKPGDHFITTTRGMRGYFAVEMWLNDEDPELGPFPEPWQSDSVSFATEDGAKARAYQLANDECLPLMT